MSIIIRLINNSFVVIYFFFFFNDTATTEIYTLSLHDALPISVNPPPPNPQDKGNSFKAVQRSEEHTSELQSQSNLVCRLLLEKKKKKHTNRNVIKKKKKKKQSKIKYKSTL